VYFLSWLSYNALIVPLSLLPMRMLYVISDGLYLIVYHLVGYRKKVVMTNLQNSFPELSPNERKVIAKKFYHHLCDLVVESLKTFTASRKEAMSRIQWVGLERINSYFDQGRPVLLAAGHYGNWELVAVTFDTFAKHHGIAIYKPLTNRYFDKKMVESRMKFGLGVMHNRQVKEEFARLKGQLTAVAFAIDQAPSAHSKPHWMTFLNQDTAVLTGLEKYAVEYNSPVIFIHIAKPKRGHYVLTAEVVCENPAETTTNEITEKSTRILEQDIKQAPEFWLWSHRRWKRRRDTATEISTPA
jgi:Kdo2-lipid IVA lauroyltransferase/acyltransferase